MVLQFDMPARWRGFLEEVCHERITDLVHEYPDVESIEVLYEELQAFDPDFARQAISDPVKTLRSSNAALEELLKDLGEKIPGMVRLVELPTDQKILLEKIRDEHVGGMIALEGVVSKISYVRPRMQHAAFACDCGHVTNIRQHDEQKLIRPLRCESHEGGCDRDNRATRWRISHEQSIRVDSQSVELQELPERVKSAQIAKRMSCLVEGDLAGQVVPGDRVIFNGTIFRRPIRRGSQETPVFELFFDVHSLERKDIPLDEIKVSDEEIEKIMELAKRDDIYEILTASIAPSIFGYKHIKNSLVLQLFGGVSRVNDDGTRSRGDIHILIMGDPGVAKSQLLNYMSDIAPRGQFASGLSSTAAGLTAAAIQSPDGGWTIEAGALPMADLGLAAIDEFDKMSDNDRSSMHEAMAQQKLSIKKAGINTTMRTRCSILAAANPLKGKFRDPRNDTSGRIPELTQQINLEPPLLSRFDVIWVMIDQPAKEEDRKIGAHIVSNRQAGTPEWLIDQGLASAPISKGANIEIKDGQLIIDPDFMIKYVSYTKKTIHPTLSDLAKEKLVDYYVKTRISGGGSTENLDLHGVGEGVESGRGSSLDSVPITARAIEGLVRLTEAHARIRLSDEAGVEDALSAIRIFDHWRYTLMGENFDETSIQSGRSTSKRNIERNIKSFIILENERTTQSIHLNEILTEMEKHDAKRQQVEDILDHLVNAGDLFRPTGRDNYQPV
ncbi:MAG TPA: minichromosome maintenance protein MCM [Candidatus Poseidoniales archaeon]|jgi:replicative DNA helicase Mcm|nr:MAG: hypothetical protein CXT68_04530 [Euryarchaeota archaeon]HIG03450.1 minichromosome maintenance protein MCM [Candidatus Poseidoniales archaeon]HIK78244.1 minichromosome maintenance protein MCM [Candidatus Poseidoniales archaeon]